MGHIYRALTLAHEFSDHEVLFVTDKKNQVTVESLLKGNYWLGVYAKMELTAQIIALQPDMVIYDALDTAKKDIQLIKGAGSIVISFEDLGSGAQHTDLTINELYDVPQFEGTKILWGHDYFFLRDEFETARPGVFEKRVQTIMLAFGGTDQHNLSRIVFRAIGSFCKEQGIFIHIVTGPGYDGYESLETEVATKEGAYLTHASGVISGIMEQAQLAITSNGRTVYEFGHMNIPSIVIAQHDREITHAFAKEENGFIPLGLYQVGKTTTLVLSALARLVHNVQYRQRLYTRTTALNFSGNKRKIVKTILSIV